jgi:hypothetical protein
MQFAVKILVSAVLIAAISEVSRRNVLMGGLLASLPLTSVLAMVWLYHDTHDVGQISRLSVSILWLVLPSLILFVILPFLLKRQIPFYGALLLSCGATAAVYTLMVLVLKRLGFEA